MLATGQLHRPSYPGMEGRETFAGHSFHSAEWDHGYDLRGKRVGVIGTGASSVQFVPRIADETQRLVVFQRTGNWFFRAGTAPIRRRSRPPSASFPVCRPFRRRFLFLYGETLTALIRHPRTAGLIGYARSAAFIRWQLRDRELRRKVWPNYTFGCKRVLFSSHFLPALQRPGVDVVTDAIARMTADGIVTADGQTHEPDCVIYGTGFTATAFMAPIQVVGANGQALRDAWDGGAHAHLGMTVSGFPSLFLFYGPNTNTSGGSMIVCSTAASTRTKPNTPSAGGSSRRWSPSSDRRLRLPRARAVAGTSALETGARPSGPRAAATAAEPGAAGRAGSEATNRATRPSAHRRRAARSTGAVQSMNVP